MPYKSILGDMSRMPRFPRGSLRPSVAWVGELAAGAWPTIAAVVQCHRLTAGGLQRTLARNFFLFPSAVQEMMICSLENRTRGVCRLVGVPYLGCSDYARAHVLS
jgi:hypothetical protein